MCLKAFQDGLGHFFSTLARLTEGEGGGGVKSYLGIWAMPIWKQHISKRGFPLREVILQMYGIAI